MDEENSHEHAVDMALSDLTHATETVYAMAHSPEHFEYLVKRSLPICEATFAISLVWSQLEKRLARAA